MTESAIGNHYLWQGRWYSWNTGLYYFRARWFDPITGRWLSKDKIGIAGGLNQYVFCLNNPINFRDPTGLEPEDSGYYYYYWLPKGFAWLPPYGADKDWYKRAWKEFVDATAWHLTGSEMMAASKGGVAAALDGMNPFGNPFEGVYADSSGEVGVEFKVSRALAGYRVPRPLGGA